MYLWIYESPSFGGKFGAVHGTDVSASFNNYRDGIGGAGSPQQRALWGNFAAAWVALRDRESEPSEDYRIGRRMRRPSAGTMIFDNDTRVENDPRAEIRKFWGSDAFA